MQFIPSSLSLVSIFFNAFLISCYCWFLVFTIHFSLHSSFFLIIDFIMSGQNMIDCNRLILIELLILHVLYRKTCCAFISHFISQLFFYINFAPRKAYAVFLHFIHVQNVFFYTKGMNFYSLKQCLIYFRIPRE